MKGECVSLTIPAKVEYLVMARLIVSAVLGRVGFDVDEIEDGKTAISEACLMLMPAPEAEAMLTIEAYNDNGIYMSISTDGKPQQSEDAPEREFSLFLLEALVDEAEFTNADGRSACRLYKALPL